MKRLILSLFVCVVMFASVLFPVYAAYDNGTGSSPMSNAIAPRRTGVPIGAVMVYENYLGSTRYIDEIEVTGVTDSMVFFNITSNLDLGTEIVQLYENSYWTNVDGQAIQIYNNGTLAFNYTDIGYPHLFIGAGVFSGPEYRGSPLQFGSSIFGKIYLGQRRATNYYDASIPRVGLVNHMEWDRQYGILLTSRLTYQNAGNAMTLIYTNLWEPNSFWIFAENFLYWTFRVIPILVLILGNYILSFVMFAFIDWMHMRSLRKKVTIQSGNMTWWYIKMMVIGILISVAIISVIMFVLRGILGLF